MSDIIDFLGFTLMIFLGVLVLFILMSPLNTIVPSIALEGGILEPYKQKTIWQLATRDYWYLTVSFFVVSALLYKLKEF